MAATPDFSLEVAHTGLVAGMDEAGRGPWAGPVVAACALLDAGNLPAGIQDSKKLSALRRETIFEALLHSARYGIGMASVEEIDTLNILGATKLAMQRAYATMGITVHMMLVDGNQPPMLPCKVQAVVKGDAQSLSIAAASILAKVTRDRLMTDMDRLYPAYGFARHAGYGTPAHQKALALHGVCPIHRKSYAPIRALIEKAAA